MPYVYHLVAPDFRGHELLPINTLRGVYPDFYERERVKYEQRESVLTYRVPYLDVPWGDTVNLAALDPAHLVAARRDLGVPVSRLLERSVARIPIERLAGRPAVIYNSRTHWINSAPGEDVPLTPPEEEFEPFDPETYSELTEVPPLHLDYLAQQRDRGRRALAFVFVRHVLVAGPVDISSLEFHPL